MGDLIHRVAEAALRESMTLLPRWLPGGVLRGHEYLVADLSGGQGESLSVNVHTGAWADFAGDARGGDLVSLYAAMRSLRQIEAAKEIAREIGLHDAPVAPAGAPPAPRADDDWTLCRPAPLDAPDWQGVLVDPRFGRAAAHWPYVDASGRLLMVVVRWNVGGEKEIRQFTCWRHRAGRLAWKFKWIDRPRPLYRQDVLAQRPTDPVLVCEGEKAADAAQLLAPGFVATTSPGGASNGQHADWAQLRGRDVIIWPDQDESEAEYAAYLATRPEKQRKRDFSGSGYAYVVMSQCVAAKVASVRVIDLAALAAKLGRGALPRGFDAADAAAGTVLDLSALAGEPPRSGVGDERRKRVPSGEYHQALIDALTAYLEVRGLAPDALDGWRRVKDWAMVNENLAGLSTDFAFEYRHHDGISMSYIVETLEALAKRRRLERRQTLLGRLTGAGDDAALRAWVRAVTGEERELDIAALRHWLWNAKRMALGLRTERDLMVVLYGHQGSGKTVAVERLCEPLAELSLMVDASYLTDDRRCPVLGAAIVGRWEEMQGSARADLEALKRTLTAPTVSYRPMRTTQTVTLPRTCSFIGTSNTPIDAMIQDVTGNRRFLQLSTPPRCDWDVIRALDPLSIWRAVDHLAPAPINAVVHLLQAHQAEHLHRDPFSLWLESESWGLLRVSRNDSPMPYEVEAYNPANGELFEDLAVRFGFWSKTVGQSSLGAKAFALRLQQEGFTLRQKRQPDGSRPRVYFRPMTPSGDSSQTSPGDEAYEPPF